MITPYMGTLVTKKRLRKTGDNDLSSKRCDLLRFHVPDGQNTRDQIMSDRGSFSGNVIIYSSEKFW